MRIPTLDRTFPGKVARFSVDVREDTRTMHTEVDVLNPGRVLLPGLYAEATVTLERKVNALAAPIQAVNQGDRNTVYVVTPSNKIEVRAVTLGIQTANDVEVLSGLQEGEIDCRQRPERPEGRPGGATQGNRIGSVSRPGRSEIT